MLKMRVRFFLLIVSFISSLVLVFGEVGISPWLAVLPGLVFLWLLIFFIAEQP